MAEWKDCMLGDLITFQRGHDLPKSKMKGGKYPVVGSNGIIGWHNEYTTDEPGITIGRSGNIGKPFLYKGKSWSHNTTLYVKEYKGVAPLFIYYFLQTLNLANYAGGSAVPTLNRNHIHTLNVHVPISIREQEKIAGILMTFDNRIGINERINDNLQQQAQIVFKHMFSNYKSTTPAKIADVSLNITDGVHNTVLDDTDGQYLLLSCKNIKNGVLNIGTSERKISTETFTKLRHRTKLAKGDVLISSVGTVGELLLLNTEPSNYEFQRSVAIVKPNPTIVSSAYLYESLMYKKAELINAAHGAVQQCLFISDIAGFPIGIPNPDDLRIFDNTVVPMFDTISANEAENSRLTELRDTLLPKLMSGELDISDLDI